MTEINSKTEVTESEYEIPPTKFSPAWSVLSEESPYMFSEQERWGQKDARYYFLRVEGDILRGELMESRLAPSSALSRIRARQPQILRRASEIRQEYGDPIQNLAELLRNMPGSQEDWEALIDEPYY
jgi:hypothetical protein